MLRTQFDGQQKSYSPFLLSHYPSFSHVYPSLVLWKYPILVLFFFTQPSDVSDSSDSGDLERTGAFLSEGPRSKWIISSHIGIIMGIYSWDLQLDLSGCPKSFLGNPQIIQVIKKHFGIETYGDLGIPPLKKPPFFGAKSHLLVFSKVAGPKIPEQQRRFSSLGKSSGKNGIFFILFHWADDWRVHQLRIAGWKRWLDSNGWMDDDCESH